MINSSTSLRACYAPKISSPLNPAANDQAKTTRRRRRAGRRTNTLCARLLRAKAQHAWRNQVLSAQIAQYELAASQQEPKSPEQKHISSVTPNVQNTPRGMTQNVRIPDNCSLKTRRMLLAMGFVGGMPTVTMQKCIRQAVPIMA